MAKRAWLHVHRWCGLAAAVLIFLQAASGCLLVYRNQVARWLDPAGMARHTEGSEAALSQVLQSLAARNPGFNVVRVIYPVDRHGVYLAFMEGVGGVERYASVDPGDARILRQGGIWAFPLTAILFFHYQLLSGGTGLAVVGCTGLLVLAMLASGLVYWWPKRGRRLQGLKIHLRMPPRVVLRQAHRSLAVSISIIACASALTGVLMVMLILPGSGSVAIRPRSMAAPQLLPHIDHILATAGAQFPGLHVRDIRMIGSDTLIAYFRDPARNPEAVDAARFSISKGTFVSPSAADLQLGSEPAILAIHNGESLGSFGKALAICSGLALLLLSITGPLMWLQASMTRRRARAGVQRYG